jgi:hypothetical protein
LAIVAMLFLLKGRNQQQTARGAIH